jgi:hypothetical protein
MPKFSDILSPNVSLTVDIAGRSGEPVKVEVTANPNAMTGELHERLVSEQDSLKMQETLIDLSLDLIVDWNLTDAEGVKLPIDRDTLKRFPIDKLDDFVHAVQEGLRPKATKKPSPSDAT